MIGRFVIIMSIFLVVCACGHSGNGSGDVGANGDVPSKPTNIEEWKSLTWPA